MFLLLQLCPSWLSNGNSGKKLPNKMQSEEKNMKQSPNNSAMRTAMLRIVFCCPGWKVGFIAEVVVSAPSSGFKMKCPKVLAKSVLAQSSKGRLQCRVQVPYIVIDSLDRGTQLCFEHPRTVPVVPKTHCRSDVFGWGRACCGCPGIVPVRNRTRAV